MLVRIERDSGLFPDRNDRGYGIIISVKNTGWGTRGRKFSASMLIVGVNCFKILNVKDAWKLQNRLSALWTPELEDVAS